jgi:hypothetical protein
VRLASIGMLECWNIGRMGFKILHTGHMVKIVLPIKLKMDNIH